MIPLFKNLEGLSGLIPHDEGMELLRLAQKVPADQAIVEIGSYKGKSTCYLAAGRFMAGGGLVYAVDPWDLPGNPYGKHGFSAPQVRKTFKAQVASLGFEEIVKPLRGFSVDVAANWTDTPIGMLFIDGDHSEQAVHNDLYAWLPHMADYSILCFDDIDTPRNPGVRVVVERFSMTSGLNFEVLAERLAVFHLSTF